MAQVRFKNSFYNPDNAPYSTEYHNYLVGSFIETYKGYDIWRYTITQWDIVKDGIVVGNYAGINGARGRIDELAK
jgi:hypothetical protein